VKRCWYTLAVLLYLQEVPLAGTHVAVLHRCWPVATATLPQYHSPHLLKLSSDSVLFFCCSSLSVLTFLWAAGVAVATSFTAHPDHHPSSSLVVLNLLHHGCIIPPGIKRHHII
jgi:hypothetical protein